MFKLKNPTKSLVVLNFAGYRLEINPLQTSGSINDKYKESLLSYVKTFELELIEENEKTPNTPSKEEVKEEKKPDKVQQSNEKIDEKSLNELQEKISKLTEKAEQLTKAIEASEDNKEKKSLTRELELVNAELAKSQVNLS